MTTPITIATQTHRCRDEELVLLPQRAMHWERAETLFITDPHFGKAATFRSAGIPIPHGGLDDDLARLTSALHETGARRLVILGDFFHARSSKSQRVLDALAAWRNSHSPLEIILILGNHDRHAGQPPDSLRIHPVHEPFALAPFCCRHHPLNQIEIAQQSGEALYILSGHLHPVVSLHDRDGSSMRLPCFHFGKRQAVLPAFGGFTGGFSVSPKRAERVFIVGPNRVIALPRK